MAHRTESMDCALVDGRRGARAVLIAAFELQRARIGPNPKLLARRGVEAEDALGVFGRQRRLQAVEQIDPPAGDRRPAAAGPDGSFPEDLRPPRGEAHRRTGSGPNATRGRPWP